MTLINHDSETVRKYLLGQLTDDQQQNFERRLLTEDELTQELEVTTEELVDEYLERRLTQKESEWFAQHFLASPEGKRSQRFATTFQQYISNNHVERKQRSWAERFASLWNSSAIPVRALAALAVVVIVVGIFWFSRQPSPRSFATLTLVNSSGTRSTGPDSPRVDLRGDGLRITLMLPETASATEYRAEVISDRGEIKTSEVVAHDAQSVTVEIPSNQLTNGNYAVTLYAKSADGATQRIRGNYYFTIE